jgi:type III pantothenate kinase
MHVVIDVGNSKTKIGIFNDAHLIDAFSFSSKQNWLKTLEKSLHKIQTSYAVNHVLVANVSSNKIPASFFKSLGIKLVNWKKTPLNITYKTPKTLGKDRIALATGASTLFPKKHVLVVSAGTCITYEFIHAKDGYLGGAISPGIRMRLQAMHTFTGKLPLLEPKRLLNNALIGDSTHDSLQKGALLGALYEIEGFMKHYTDIYLSVNVILTGGDAIYFENELKNRIFAEPNLSLIGLNTILNANMSA